MAAGGRLAPNGARAWSINPNLIPGRALTDAGAVIVCEIAARTEPAYLCTPRSRYSQAKATRPGWLDSIGKLAGVCRGLLEKLDLTGVIVAGSSIGGWVAAELALAAPERVGRLVEFAAAIPGAVLQVLPAAGHLPQLENSEAVLSVFGGL